MSVKASILLLYVALLLVAPLAAAQQTTTPAPQPPIKCPSKADVATYINTLNAVVLLAVLLLISFALFFTLLGSVSNILLRIGEFFNERLRFVFDIAFIYMLFLWGLDPDTMIAESNGCAVVLWDQVMANGPLFFRLIYWAAHMLGLV